MASQTAGALARAGRNELEGSAGKRRGNTELDPGIKSSCSIATFVTDPLGTVYLLHGKSNRLRVTFMLVPDLSFPVLASTSCSSRPRRGIRGDAGRGKQRHDPEHGTFRCGASEHRAVVYEFYGRSGGRRSKWRSRGPARRSRSRRSSRLKKSSSSIRPRRRAEPSEGRAPARSEILLRHRGQKIRERAGARPSVLAAPPRPRRGLRRFSRRCGFTMFSATCSVA